MKKSLMLTIICLFTVSGLFAQDCTHFLYLQKDKTIEMTGFNKKGDVTVKTVSKVSDVKTEAGSVTATVVTEVYDKAGKLRGTSDMDYKCDGNNISMQMHLTTDQQSKQASTVNVSVTSNNAEQYPADMKVGDHLKDYTSQVQMVSGTTATVKVTDRMVEAKENITTAAGTWECFKINYKSSITTTFAKSSSDTTNKFTSVFNKLGIKPPTTNSETTIWYAPGFAVIKTESKNGYTEITGIK